MKNRIYSLRDKHCRRIPYKLRFGKKAIAWLREQSIGPIDDALLRSDIALLKALDEQIGFVEERIVALAMEGNQIRLLMTMTSVSCFAAMFFLAKICTIDRFCNEKRLSFYARDF